MDKPESTESTSTDPDGIGQGMDETDYWDKMRGIYKCRTLDTLRFFIRFEHDFHVS